MTKFLLYNLFNYTQCLLITLGLIYAAKYFFKLSPKNHTTKKEIILFPLLLSLLLTSLSFIDLGGQRYISSALSELIIFLNTIIYLIWLRRYTRYKNFQIPLLLLVFVDCVDKVVSTVDLYLWYTYEEWFLSLPSAISFLSNFFWPLLTFLAVIFICKTVPLKNGLQRLLDFPKLIYGAGILYYAIETIIFVINIDTLRTSGMEYISLYVSGGYMLTFLAVVILLREAEHKYSLSYSKKLLAEQQIYVEHVESLYSDLQKQQHDYKNLLSGMYLQVSEGRIDEVKKYLSDNLMSTDEVLQNNLKSQKQLGNIKMIEVKSLVLTKMLRAREHNVIINLEAANAITKVSISLKDFLRILGIAIDNAIEAAGVIGQKAKVDILFMQENNYVEVVVKNPFRGSIDSDKIWQKGFSTKGTDRGMGLSNYRDILDSYQQVLRETRITDHHFIQSISIPM